MEIKIEKLTGVDLLRRANSFTTGRDSHMTLAKAYRYGHSPIRTQIFWIEMRDIPLFCASQFVRSHVGVQWYQRSRRTDRGGADFRELCMDIVEDLGDIYTAIDEGKEYDPLHILGNAIAIEDMARRFDRCAPTDLACLINAEAIINMSHKRLCTKASKETREIWEEVVARLEESDPDLADLCVPPCVHTGFCSEPKPCGYIEGSVGKAERDEYLKLFYGN